MPQVSRSRRTVIKREIKTITSEGEITINLNLSISLDENDNVRVAASSGTQKAPPQRVPPAVDPEEKKSPEIVPTELFSAGDELLEGFGEKK